MLCPALCSQDPCEGHGKMMEFKAALRSCSMVSHCYSLYFRLFNLNNHLLIKSLWFERTFRSWVSYIPNLLSLPHGFGIPVSQHSPSQAWSASLLWQGPRDGPLVYQRCLAQARVTEGGAPNIGLPVTQPHLSPGSESPSHHLALLPGPVPEMVLSVSQD